MEKSTEQYYIVGVRPVKVVKNNKGELGAYAFDWVTGELVLALRYVNDIYFRHSDDVERVSEEEFSSKVEELRKKIKEKKSE